MSCHSRLANAFANAPVLPLGSRCRYAIISDCHRGTGTSNDNFLKNQHLYFTALTHYYNNGFSYIELGDGDELWENRSMSQILEIHNNVFWLLDLLARRDRLYMVYGNHDMEKKRPSYGSRSCSTYFCTDTQRMQPLFQGLTFYEGIILEGPACSGQDPFRIHLTHGHQADLLNSTLWKLARFLVRYIWNPLEHFGVLDPTSAAKNYTRKDRVEQRLSDYAAQNDLHLITGHTHRPRLDPADLTYMNTGSCVHPRCITCLEIAHSMITLVKWAVDVKKDRTLFVTREVLSQCPLFPLHHN